jgi:hypothetical protein
MRRFTVVLLGVLLAGLAVGCGHEAERNINRDRDKPQRDTASEKGGDKGKVEAAEKGKGDGK